MADGRALVLCPEGAAGLLGSYGRALAKVGVSVTYWSLAAAVESNARFGRVGQTMHRYLPFEPWVTKGNRELITQAMDLKPDFLFTMATADLRAGTLAQIKAALPGVKIVLVWQDTMLNLTDRAILCMHVVDLVACYSKATVPLLERLGAHRVAWVPFAVDGELFPEDVAVTSQDRARYQCDVSFIGNHRPEREREVLQLLDAGFTVQVWGVDTWQRAASRPARLGEYFQGKPLFGPDMGKAMRCAKVSLNSIDPTNFPAANMRFFETFACFGTPLCSSCPEMEDVFIGGETAMYYEPATLVSQVRALTENAELRASIRDAGAALARGAHTYEHRISTILAALLE